MIQNNTNKPEVSVLMSIYTESEDAIMVAVQSILEQTFTNFELILVNDNPASKDTQRILDTLATQDNRIRILTNDRNRGLGYALNAAIQSANADIIARMDTEDSSLPERFEKQISLMKAHTNVDLLFTQWIDVDEQKATIVRQPNRIDFTNMQKSFFTKALLMHPTLMAHKKVFLDNPYPEMGRPEDIVLWLQLIRQGYTFDILEEPLYEYRIDKINITQRYNKIKAYAQNLIPHLIRESRYYWSNIYFWLFFGRTLFEYLVSRNIFIFKFTHAQAARMWKVVFGS